jgi:hypothetical protein
MTETRTYRLPPYLRWMLPFAGVFFLFVVGSILLKILQGGQPLDGTIFFFSWLAVVLAVIVYNGNTSVVRITMEDDTITFRSLFRTTRLPVSSILSVGIGRWGSDSPFFVHPCDKFRLLFPLEGMHDLLTRLKEKNPSIEISPRL